MEVAPPKYDLDLPPRTTRRSLLLHPSVPRSRIYAPNDDPLNLSERARLEELDGVASRVLVDDLALGELVQPKSRKGRRGMDQDVVAERREEYSEAAEGGGRFRDGGESFGGE